MSGNRAFVTTGIVLAMIALVAVVRVTYMSGQRHPAPVSDQNSTAPTVSANNSGPVVAPAIDDAETPTATQEHSKQTAYIKDISLEAGKYFLTVDYVDWLGGKAAVQAALEDGDCAIEGLSTAEALTKLAMMDANSDLGEFGNCTPNGFYIRNVKPKLRKLEVVSGIKVEYRPYWKNCDTDCRATLELSELARILSGEKLTYFNHESEFKNNPYDIEVLSSRIERITWRYLP